MKDFSSLASPIQHTRLVFRTSFLARKEKKRKKRHEKSISQTISKAIVSICKTTAAAIIRIDWQAGFLLETDTSSSFLLKRDPLARA